MIAICFWQVDAYEAKNQELMAENADLRALLRSMQVYDSIQVLLWYSPFYVVISWFVIFPSDERMIVWL